MCWRLLLVCLLIPGTIWAQGKNPKPKTPLGEAKERLLRGNYAEAIAAFEKLTSDEKTAPLAYVGIARAQGAQGEYAKALASLETGLKGAPKHNALLAEKADWLYFTGKYQDALDIAEAVIKADKDHFLAHWVRARYYRDTGAFDKADVEMRWFVKYYKQRDDDDKPIEDAEELVFVGMAGAENARWHGLGDQFKFLINDLYPDALKDNPNMWTAEYQIGLLLLEKYNRPEAEQAFDNAIKINANCADAMVGKGLIAIQNYQFQDAETQAKAALKVNPNHPGALRLIADVQFLGGEITKAQEYLTKAVAVNPVDEATQGRLAACARALNQPKEIEKIIAAVEKVNPKPHVFYHDFGRNIEDRKIYDDAEKYLKKAVELRKELPSAKAALALLYLRLGKEAEAKPLLDEAFNADRFNVRVSNSIKVLKHLQSYETIKTKHYDIRFDPKKDQLLANLFAEYVEEIHDELKADFQFEPKERTLIEIFNNHEMFSGRTVALPDLHTVGACTGRVVTMVSPGGAGISKKFNWGRVIRHELVHVFNLAQTDFQVPHWVTEGLAVRKEGGNRPPMWMATLRERYEQDKLLNLDNILMAFVRPASQAEWSLAYCQSNLYVEYLIKSHGIESVGPMLDAFRSGMETGDAIKKVCKVDKATFEKGYKGYVGEILKSIPGRSSVAVKPMTLAELEKAYEKDPSDLDIAARLADQYSRRKMSDKARKMVDDILKTRPGQPLASIVKASLLSAAGESEAAQKLLEEALEKNANDGKLLLALSKRAIKEKDWDKAIKYLEKGRKMAPLDREGDATGDWLTDLIEIYTKQEKTAELTDVLIEQVANDPDDLQSRLKLGHLQLAAKKFREAEVTAWDAIRIDVNSKEAQKILVDASQGLGKTERVEKLQKLFQ